MFALFLAVLHTHIYIYIYFSHVLVHRFFSVFVPHVRSLAYSFVHSHSSFDLLLAFTHFSVFLFSTLALSRLVGSSDAVPGIVVTRRSSHRGHIRVYCKHNERSALRIQAILKNITRYNSTDWTCPWPSRPCRTFTVFIYRGRCCCHITATCTDRFIVLHAIRVRISPLFSMRISVSSLEFLE